ncbi:MULTISPECIES: hypothetical protein [unclassified Bradyrhizobium]|uniref:hypothetical protein n=1 Tax=unclassified Bradyrhizobium TaxID=2631580 RepID=UPI001FF7B6BC|nr:hypothetical protein [Bradyrhizobium sp. CW12]MCK1644670.1 hypothetical protein [Bradyrhizobium sp. 154]
MTKSRNSEVLYFSCSKATPRELRQDIKVHDMTWTVGNIHAGGHFSACRLLTADNSDTIIAGITTYDGCSIPTTLKIDEVFVCLGGTVRIIYGDDYDRVVEARLGDVVWIPKGSKVKYQGEKGSIFYTCYPVDYRTRSKPIPTEAANQVRIFQSKDMVFAKNEDNTVGHMARCRILTPENGISKYLGAVINTLDGCSYEWTAHYDQAIVVLEGIFRIRAGENYSQIIEAGFGDVIRIPKGTQFKYEGEKAKIFSALYPINWKEVS